MNKHLLLLVSLILFSAAQSQNNGFSPGARWYNTTEEWSGACVEHEEFNAYFNGDTVISGNQYFMLYHQGLHYSSMKGQGSNCPANPYHFTRYMYPVRYDQEKILIWNNNHDNVFLDYNLHAGDSIHNVDYLVGGGAPLKITSIDSVLISGVYLKRFYYLSDENSMMVTRYIIEKIGSFHGFTSGYTGHFESNNNLNCYAENNNVLYTEPAGGSPCELTVGTRQNSPASSISIYPNPASSLLSINSADEAIHSLRVLNAFGQAVLQSTVQAASSINVSLLAPGLYFLEIKTATGTTLKKFIRE